jgi:WD40 repeat protein
MNGETRLVRELPQLLADLGAGRSPDYTESLLARTAVTRQRPGWVFPERWFPMSALTQRMAAPRIPVRIVAVAALLVLALAAAALLVGSQHRRVPAPFGPAANGLIPYISNGEIHVGNPVTGETRLLQAGIKDPAAPQFSPDGTRLTFLVESGTGATKPVDVYVMRDDGSDVHKVTPKPVWNVANVVWTPDGRIAIVSSSQAGSSDIDVYDAAGGGAVGHFTVAADADLVEFRPPDGRRFLYRAPSGLYELDMETGVARVILAASLPDGNDFWGGATWSADGSRVFYTRPYAVATSTGTCCSLWVMNADGSDQHQFIPNGGTSWDGVPDVSPDGKLLAFWNGSAVSVAPVDGSRPAIRTGPVLSGTAAYIWSPDATKLLMIPSDGSSPNAYLLDPAGGPATKVPWSSDADLDWQRTAGN